MIGTALYTLGVIACMILIVLVAVAVFGAAFVALRMMAPLLCFLAMAALAWWLGVKGIISLGVFAAIIWGIWWLSEKHERDKRKAYHDEQKMRWAVLDKSWNREATSVQDAFYWEQRHADDGNANAQWRLGRLYEQGECVPQDYIQAYKWRALATQNLSPNAREYHKTLRNWSEDHDALAAKMTPRQIVEAERLVAEWFEQHSEAALRSRA